MPQSKVHASAQRLLLLGLAFISGDSNRRAVIDCIRLTLVEALAHRAAGAAAFGDEDYMRGIEVGVACSTYLRELLGERPTDA